jgi:hypothetical protein
LAGRATGGAVAPRGSSTDFGELAFAVQFVEQRFELVIADQIAAGAAAFGAAGAGAEAMADSSASTAKLPLPCNWSSSASNSSSVMSELSPASGPRRSRRRHRIGGELAFAVQLIEQRLELGVGDFVTGGGSAVRYWSSSWRFGFGLDGIQRVQQLFELVVGDVARVAFGNGLFDHFGDRRRLVGRLRLGQTRQRRQQFRCGGRDRTALADFAEHAVDRVQCFEHHVHQFRVNATLTLAQDVEHVLGDVTALHQLIELKEAGAPFYSVETAKNCIEQVRIIRPAFQLDQLLGQLLKNFAGLNQEILKDFFIGAEAH